MIVATEDSSGVNAVKLLAGVEPLLEAPEAQDLLSSWSLRSGAPEAAAALTSSSFFIIRKRGNFVFKIEYLSSLIVALIDSVSGAAARAQAAPAPRLGSIQRPAAQAAQGATQQRARTGSAAALHRPAHARTAPAPEHRGYDRERSTGIFSTRRAR